MHLIRRRGFSFIEVMFSVTILGLGFVMVAAMFPVTIRQTRSTMDEAAACNLAKEAMASVTAMATNESMPVTGGAMAVPEATGLASASGGNIAGGAYGICSSDPRYAWVALYSREDEATAARVIVIVTRCYNVAAYGAADRLVDVDDPASPPANLEPRAVAVTVTDGGGGPDIVKFSGGATFDGAGAAAPGAILVISNNAGDPRGNGRILQIGNPVEGQEGVWELVPGNDLQDASENVPRGSRGYLVGRGYADVKRPGAGYAGPAQEVAAFSTFVNVR